MKIILTGGGTGGHIYPALSIADELRREDQEVELLFVGSKHGPEGRLAEQTGLRYFALPSRQLSKPLSVAGLQAILTLGVAGLKALFVLMRERPDVVIGTGGYTSAAVMLAQCLRRGPSVIHEQNVAPGRTNTMLAKCASAVCVTVEESRDFFPVNKVVLTGLPVRRDILVKQDKTSARQKLGLNPDRFTVFVYGGSQGARRINTLMTEAALILRGQGVQVLHQTGERNYEEVSASAPDDESYRVTAYLDDPSAAFWAADLIVCRSGASTLAELTAAGLPAILLPYRYAYANHQEKNAKVLEEHGAAVLMDEASCDPGELANQIAALQRDPERLRQMAKASSSLAHPDAAAHVVRVAKSLIHRGSKA